MRRRIIILFAIVLSAACTKESSSRREAVVHIETALASREAGTKALWPSMGSAFGDEGSYGIVVCESGSTTAPHKANSKNVKALYRSEPDTWKYYYVENPSSGSVGSQAYDDLTLSARDDHHHADLYAYSPYMQSVYTNGLTAIPYNIVNQADLMYAEENLTNANSDLNPESGSDLSAHFTFKHAFALLEFNFKAINNPDPYEYYHTTLMQLNNITVTVNPEVVGNTARLYTAGTLNALTGELTNTAETTSLTLEPKKEGFNLDMSSPTNWTPFYILLSPITIEQDDALIFTFTITGQTMQPFSLKVSQLTHSDGVTVGFQPGYKYSFYFTVDNYIKFSGFEISTNWESLPLATTEI